MGRSGCIVSKWTEDLRWVTAFVFDLASWIDMDMGGSLVRTGAYL